MKFIWNIPVIATIIFCFYACNASTNEAKNTTEETNTLTAGQSAVQDNESAKCNQIKKQQDPFAGYGYNQSK